MAGDWIKVEISTPDKSEVFAVADDLDIDPDAAFGKLIRVWMWFDQHSEDGHATSVTKKLLDRVVAVPGFCESMITHNWMVEDEEGISLPNFDRHNGETAKKRALGARRKAKQRKNSQDSHANTVTGSHAKSGTSAGAREEKSMHTYIHATDIINRLKEAGISERDFLKTKPRQMIDQWLKTEVTSQDLDSAIDRALEAMPENLCTAYINPIVLQEVNLRKNPQEINSNAKNKSISPQRETALEQTNRETEEFLRDLNSEEDAGGDGACLERAS